MKAVLFREFGDLDVLKYQDTPTPPPAPDQVLVRLHAAGLNHADLLVRQGGAHFKLSLPMIWVWKVRASSSKSVRTPARGALANASSSIRIRTAASALLPNEPRKSLCRLSRARGTDRRNLCEYVAVPAANALPIPDALSFEQAAATVVAFQTAWHLLITRGKLQAGETILIVGAGGGVASAGCRSRGLRAPRHCHDEQ